MNILTGEKQARPENPIRTGMRKIRGLTLIELMVSMSIAAILLLFAAPSFSQFMAAQTVRLASIDLYTAMVQARNEAIKRNVTVTLSPKGGDWTAGWEILNPADATKKLHDHGAVSNLGVATVPDPLVSIQFDRSGRISGAASASFSLSSTEYPSLDKHCIQFDLSGRARIEKKPTC